MPGDFFVALIFQQPAHQFLPRIFLLFFAFFRRLGKQHLRFDANERGR
jgi:hypothetical protein